MAKVWTLYKFNVNNMGPVKTFATIICSLLSILTTVEQSIVIYVISSEKVLRESSHSYILSLSLTGRWINEYKKPLLAMNEKNNFWTLWLSDGITGDGGGVVVYTLQKYAGLFVTHENNSLC